MLPTKSLAVVALAAAVSAGSIKDIKHIVLFMQENRGFDHVSYPKTALICLVAHLGTVLW